MGINVRIISGHFLRRLKKITKNLRIVGVTGEIRTEYLPTTSQELFRLMQHISKLISNGKDVK
jgi:hypothetical protein